MRVPPAASGVVLLHVLDEVDLLTVPRPRRATREVSAPAETEGHINRGNSCVCALKVGLCLSVDLVD